MIIRALSGNLGLSEFIISLMSCFVIIFVALPIHEWAHGFVSTKLGDPTPRYQGRLTLNPLAHIDWLGAAGILLFGIGWAKPVQVNARYYKSPKWGMALVALAGPLSNLIVAFFSFFLYGIVVLLIDKTGLMADNIILQKLIYLFFSMIAQISVNLAIFNLIPIPPFDGSRILFTFLPQKYYFMIMKYEQFIFIGILVLLYTGILDLPISLLSGIVLSFIKNIALLPFTLFI